MAGPRDFTQIKAPEDFANVLDGARIRVGTVKIQNGLLRFEINTVAGEHVGVEVTATMAVSMDGPRVTCMADTKLRLKPLG